MYCLHACVDAGVAGSICLAFSVKTALSAGQEVAPHAVSLHSAGSGGSGLI